MDLDLIPHLALGFQVALTWQNLAYCFVGVLLGTLVGVLPGLGPLATMSMLLPLTFSLPPVGAIIMLAGIYYGAQYGGSSTAILINLPGEASSVVTAIDGYRMALAGRAGEALAAAALGSFFAGTVATMVIAMLAPPLTELALSFTSAEYFSLMVLGLIASVALAHGSVLKALAMVVIGILLGLTGQDLYTGVPRFTFELPDLFDGLDFIAVAMGVFGLGEIMRNLGDDTPREPITQRARLFISRDLVARIAGPVVRGTVIGSLLGILPGGGALLSSFASYATEKKISKDPSRFGKGAIEGVAGPESANNSGAQTSFIPMLTLGLPSNPVMALMVGALIIQGITPGPKVITNNPDLFWGLIASMWIGNAMLLILNFPLIGIWIQLLRVRYQILFPIITAVCCVGVFSLDNQTFNVFVMAAFGLVGFVLVKLDCEPAPLLLGFILGPMLEENLRRAMLVSGGDPTVLVTRPISACLLGAAVLILLVLTSPRVLRTREEALRE
jgi:TctA family transporter